MARTPLSPGDLLKVTVSTLVEAEEAVAALVERLFGQVPALYTDDETLVTEVSVFLKSVREFGTLQRTQLTRALQQLRAEGVPIGRSRIRTERLPHRDWAEAWKRHIKPLDIAGRLLVKPTWSRRRPRRDQVVVLIDPGLSFGTGQHPTTAFCLEQVVALRPAGAASSLLDIGTGSGILAIAAAKLGYAPVEAFDFDPEAVTVSVENARLNGVGDRVRPRTRDLRCLPRTSVRRFDVVCANLLADLLLAQPERITARVAPGGTLVLAGILAAEFERVVTAYASLGWRLVADRAVKEWRSGAFRRS